ncbi:hypothetical protein EMCRGX_G010943 [Ephydatia muelleri]|eukprot:Em0006g1353a
MCEYSTVNVAQVHRLHNAPTKKSTIPFTVRLVENNHSSPEKGISGHEVPADGSAVTFAPHRYPKLQSFKSAHHSKSKEKIVLVGGRTAGLHGFSDKVPNFSQADQNYALYVINLATDITTAAMLPANLQESVGVMNAQAQQVTNSKGKNYLFVVGGYGWSSTSTPPRNITHPTLTIITVDELIDSIEAAAKSKTVPEISRFISQTSNKSFQVTGGEMLFVPASSSVSKADTFHLVVGQCFEGNYGGRGDYQDSFKYSRSILTFPVPYLDANGNIPTIELTVLNASNCTSDAHNKSALDAQLARRDLNVVPTFLPTSFDEKTGKALPGALILSGVFQQDGSNAPYLQPIVFSFNKEDTKLPQDPDNPIKSFTVKPFFQMYNNYSCANLQLFSAKDQAIYNVLMGGVSYFFSSDTGGLDQATSLFQVPFTTDVSILKMDNHGHCTQALSPKSDMFFSSTKITTFGTEALFIPDNGLSTCTKANLSSEIFDLDQIRSNWKIPVRLGSILGGIESSEAVRFPPVFHPEYTVASSRLIDVYLEMAPSHK